MKFLSLFPVRLLLLAVLAVAVHPQPSYAQDSTTTTQLPKRLVGDYGYWSKFANPSYSAAQIPFERLTHINHDGVSFNADGTLSVPDGFIEPELTNLAHAKGVKVLLLIGGDFPGVEANGTIQTLVENLKNFAKNHDYDGFDIDWEYPATTADRRLLVDLMSRLRYANPNYVLSVDVAPWGGYGYDLIDLPKWVDYLNIMMYDCAGPWTA
ncbi:MAG: glycoside hydrolase family 18 protein, partial [Candidatus Sulfotelmatobacter sp.]